MLRTTERLGWVRVTLAPPLGAQCASYSAPRLSTLWLGLGRGNTSSWLRLCCLWSRGEVTLVTDRRRRDEDMAVTGEIVQEWNSPNLIFKYIID